MAKVKSKADIKLSEEKKRSKLFRPSEVLNDKNRKSRLSVQGQDPATLSSVEKKRQSHMSINVVMSPNELVDDEWKCTVVMVVEGSGDYIKYTHLMQEAIGEGQNQRITCITQEQVLASVKQARHRDAKGLASGQAKEEQETRGARRGLSQSRHPSNNTLTGKRSSHWSVTTSGKMGSLKSVPEEKKAPGHGSLSGATAAGSPTSPEEEAAAAGTGAGAAAGTAPAAPVANSVATPQASRGADESADVLRSGGDLSAAQTAQLLRADLLRFRKDQLRRRHSEAENRKHTSSDRDLFSEKPILNTLVNGEKERTRLRKRGCLVSKMESSMDGMPEDSRDLYVILLGFHSPQLPQELLRAGVPLTGIVLLTSEEDQRDAMESAARRWGDVRTLTQTWMFVHQAEVNQKASVQRRAEEEAVEAAKQRNWAREHNRGVPGPRSSDAGVDRAAQYAYDRMTQSTYFTHGAIEIQNFWQEFDNILWNPSKYDSLKDVALMSVIVPSMKDLDESEVKNFLYDEVSNAVYDVTTAQRHRQSYSARMMTTPLNLPVHLPRLALGGRSATLYNTAVHMLPAESVDIPLRMRAMLQQVEYWLSGSSVRESDVTQRQPSFVDVSMVDVVKSDLESFFDTILNQYGQPALSQGKVKFKDPLVVVQGDLALMRTFHVPQDGNVSVSASEVEVLGNMRVARMWDTLPPPPWTIPDDPFRYFARGFQERMRLHHGVQDASAQLLLELVAFLSLKCDMPADAEPEAPRPRTPPVPDPALSSRVASKTGSEHESSDSLLDFTFHQDTDQDSIAWSSAGRDPNAGSSSIRSGFGGGGGGGGSIKSGHGGGSIKSGRGGGGGSIKSGRMGSIREAGSGGSALRYGMWPDVARASGSAAGSAKDMRLFAPATARDNESLGDWDTSDMFVWDEIPGEFHRFDEWPDDWAQQPPPRLSQLRTVHDVVRLVEATLEPDPAWGTEDVCLTHAHGHDLRPSPPASKGTSLGTRQQRMSRLSLDMVSLSNASVPLIQRQLCAQQVLDQPDPLGAPYSIEARRYARELSPNIMLQQLLKAQVELQCFDVEYFRPTDVILVRAHNPLDSNGMWTWRMSMALPSSDVSLRDFYAVVQDESSEWLALEDERHERRKKVRAMREALVARRLQRGVPPSGLPTELLPALPPTSATGRRTPSRATRLPTPSGSVLPLSGLSTYGTTTASALRKAADAFVAEADGLLDPEPISLWTAEDFLMPNSIKMALRNGDRHVVRIRDRRTMVEAMADADAGPAAPHLDDEQALAGSSEARKDSKRSKQAVDSTGRSKEDVRKGERRRGASGKLSNGPRGSGPAATRLSTVLESGSENAGEATGATATATATASATAVAPGASTGPATAAATTESLVSESIEQGGPAPLRDPALPGFELGPRRWQLLADKRRFAATDGSTARVEVRDWLHRNKELAFMAVLGGHTLALTHEARPMSGRPPHRINNFHLTLENGVVLAFGRTPSGAFPSSDAAPSGAHNASPPAPPTSPVTNMDYSSNTWTPGAAPSSSVTSTPSMASSAHPRGQAQQQQRNAQATSVRTRPALVSPRPCPCLAPALTLLRP